MHDEFHRLPSDTLRSLAAALRTGRLSFPFSAVALDLYCADEDRVPIAACMQQLASEGWKPEQLALLLESIVEARIPRPGESRIIDLVWSGPTVPGLVNRDTGSVVRELFHGACEQVLLAGYAVWQGREVFRSLAQRMQEVPSLKVRMFLDIQRKVGDDSPASNLVAEFARRFHEREWPGGPLPEVYYDPRSLAVEVEKRSSLHAKCVVVDRRVAFVSSANFTEAAQVRNIEVGVLIHSVSFAAMLAQHFEVLASEGILQPLPPGPTAP